MFDATIHSSWEERSRRGFTTLTSLGLQVLVVGVLLVLPLIWPTDLPFSRRLPTPISLGQPLGEPPALRLHAGANTSAPTNPDVIVLRPAAPRLAFGLPVARDDGPPQVGPSGPATGGTGGPDGVLSSLGAGTRSIMPLAPAPIVPPLHVSHMSEGNLVHKVLPAYPSLARSARIQGQVVLQAVISKLGTIENLRVLAGHPMLVRAAVDAVSQWRYRPYVLNNEPVEVETEITVNFSLAGN
jgi:periplasmic protein TonB